MSRPTRAEHDLPPEDTEAQKCTAATKDTVETSEEQHAEEEPQGEPDPPTQKRVPPEIKFILSATQKIQHIAQQKGDFSKNTTSGARF